MSLTLNMVGGGSGGGDLPLDKPLIHITAILGSDIEISLGGVIVKAIPSSKAIPNINGISAEYYYSASATGTYTITATKGSRSLSKTITVSEVKQYDVSVNILIIYDLGDENVSITGGIHSAKGVDNSGYSLGTMTKNADNIVLSSGSAQSIAAVTVNKIDLSGYSEICIEATNVGGSQPPRIVFTNNSDGSMGNVIANYQFSTTGIQRLDISNVGTYSGYVAGRALASSGTTSYLTFKKIWVEG